MTQGIRKTAFLSESAFRDPYLAETENAYTGVMRVALTRRLDADFLLTHAYDYGVDRFSLTPAGADEERSASSVRAGLNWRLGGAVLRFEHGLKREDGTILDARFDGAGAATTLYGAAEADVALSPRWRLKGRFASGYTMADAVGFGGLVDGFSNLTTSQFSAAVVRQGFLNDRDSLWLGVSQPLQIETGAINLTLPTAFDQLTETLSYSSESGVPGAARKAP